MTGFDITEAPGYSPLINQIKTLKSFRRPILLVDDLLHNGYRLEKLDPLFKQEGLEVDRIIVSILSGRGRGPDENAGAGGRMRILYSQPQLLVYGKPSLRLYRRRQRGGPEPGARFAAFHQFDPAL